MCVSRNPKHTWRRTTLSVRGRGLVHSECTATRGKRIQGHAMADAIELGCEGAEFDRVENVALPKRVRAMVVAYAFSRDSSAHRFRKISSRLEARSRSVHDPLGAMRRPCAGGVYTRHRGREVVVHCSR